MTDDGRQMKVMRRAGVTMGVGGRVVMITRLGGDCVGAIDAVAGDLGGAIGGVRGGAGVGPQRLRGGLRLWCWCSRS